MTVVLDTQIDTILLLEVGFSLGLHCEARYNLALDDILHCRVDHLLQTVARLHQRCQLHEQNVAVLVDDGVEQLCIFGRFVGLQNLYYALSALYAIFVVAECKFRNLYLVVLALGKVDKRLQVVGKETYVLNILLLVDECGKHSAHADYLVSVGWVSHAVLLVEYQYSVECLYQLCTQYRCAGCVVACVICVALRDGKSLGIVVVDLLLCCLYRLNILSEYPSRRLSVYLSHIGEPDKGAIAHLDVVDDVRVDSKSVFSSPAYPVVVDKYRLCPHLLILGIELILDIAGKGLEEGEYTLATILCSKFVTCFEGLEKVGLFVEEEVVREIKSALDCFVVTVGRCDIDVATAFARNLHIHILAHAIPLACRL